MVKRKKKKTRPRSGFKSLVLIFLFAVFVSFVLYGVLQIMQYQKTETVIDMPQGGMKTDKGVGNVSSKRVSAYETKKAIKHPYKNIEVPRSVSKKKEQLIRHKGYTVSYNSEWKIPNWVGYELLRSELDGGVKRDDNFVPDPQVKGKSAGNADYRRSGFDRGHMAPAADMTWDKQAMQE